MIKEWQIAEGRRDSTHEFQGRDYYCRDCGKPRCFHVKDGFIPAPIGFGRGEHSIYCEDPGVRYRGPHPRWTRPGTIRLSQDEEKQIARFVRRAELTAATRASKQISVRSLPTPPKTSVAPVPGMQ